jgi:hypothetical protein
MLETHEIQCGFEPQKNTHRLSTICGFKSCRFLICEIYIRYPLIKKLTSQITTN